ncbi:phage tail domain-containing protein [Microbacterium caowuchunii]|uniref:Siphovirus-type tail component RIFT-related domain-containing protein n=1 Tax=Microbacterium caowuchunii TaxID=2614638 RepID=A0A5N0TH14_9MICO|nr:phage tail domain-containing protein [Microbacterium caowuchunii]KAA9133764.1 hypothetical protein F6B40_08415 [Microbacterium caowuchunii]
MSFTFGEFDTDDLGLIATLRELPSVDGLQLETLEAVGTDGRVLGGTTRSGSRFTFDVILEGRTPEEAASKRESVALALDPARGEQRLTFDAAPGWQWAGILSASIRWQRVTWDAGAGYKLRADVTFDCLEAFGRPIAEEAWQHFTPGNRTVRRALGNARSYPTVEIEGVLSASQKVSIRVADLAVDVAGPLQSGQVLRLDWDKFDFGKWVGPVKVASVVRAMSTLDRAELWPGESAAFNVATTGSVSRVALIANSRRQ